MFNQIQLTKKKKSLPFMWILETQWSEGLWLSTNVHSVHFHLQGCGLLIANFKDSSWDVNNA